LSSYHNQIKLQVQPAMGADRFDDGSIRCPMAYASGFQRSKCHTPFIIQIIITVLKLYLSRSILLFVEYYTMITRVFLHQD